MGLITDPPQVFVLCGVYPLMPNISRRCGMLRSDDIAIRSEGEFGSIGVGPVDVPTKSMGKFSVTNKIEKKTDTKLVDLELIYSIVYKLSESIPKGKA